MGDSSHNLVSVQVETKRAKECEYIVPKSGPVPSMPEIEVKLTTAALLREHSRFQKIIDSDKQKLQNLERELRDDSHMKAYELCRMKCESNKRSNTAWMLSLRRPP